MSDATATPATTTKRRRKTVGVLNHSAKLLHPMPQGPKANPLRLMPGFNRVDAELWESVTASNFVQSRLRNRKLEVIDGAPELADMNDDRALALISQTLDRQLLRTWQSELEASGRRTILEGLVRQLASLDGSKPG